MATQIEIDDAKVLLQRSRPPLILLNHGLEIVAAEPYALELLAAAFPEQAFARTEIPVGVLRILRDTLRSTPCFTTVIADLILHVSQLHGGQTLYALSVERQVFRDHLGRAALEFALSKREEEVLALIIGGGRAADIADALSISVTTVNGHFRNLMRKMGVRNRFELVAKTFGA